MIENDKQLVNTRNKLAMLQRSCDDVDREPGDAHVRELTHRSLKHRINQMTEEIARYESQLRSEAMRH